MAKKYIGLEEAAELLGIQQDELIRRREAGDVRGFADRGTWKFKLDDLDELKRRLQADSNPDVPLLAGDDDPSGSSILGGEEDEVGEQSTTIRGGVKSDADLVGATSDSDVRLILDDGLGADDSEQDKTMFADADSDSDVQLYDDQEGTVELGSDSDVALVGSDSMSDVKLAPAPTTDPGSDSDVRLVDDDSGKTEDDAATVELSSDSDVKLVGGSIKKDAGSDSDVALVVSDEGGSSVVLSDDDDDSESVLLSEESGIQFAAESGISLEQLDDSGISLEADSGLSLAGDDSGLSILDADSGLTLEADSGIALDDMEGTAPLLKSPSLDSDDADTELEIPATDSGGDSGFELQLEDSGTGSSGDSSVLLFEDEDEDPDEHSPTMVKKASAIDELEGETFDLTADDGDDFDLEEDEFGDDLDVTDDVIGEDDELDDLDVFDADDDVFDEAMDTGESHAEFAAPHGLGRVEAAAPAAEWGGGTFAALLVSTALMALCGMMMFDLVRGMWSWNEPASFNSAMLDALSGLFSS